MQAEIIAIGTELLQGTIVDTNSPFLQQQLATIGIAVQRVTLVRDTLPEMIEVIRGAMERVDLVICSGGLGPTGDDLTRQAIAEAIEQPLEFHQMLLDDIAERFASFNRTMSPSNRQQAFIPRGAYIIRNPRGTAPCFVAEHNERLVAALPGVPQELHYLTEHALLPYLRDERGVRDVIVVRETRVAGLPESVAGERIADMIDLTNPIVGITTRRGQHTIRLAATATSQAEADALLQPLLQAIEERFVGNILSEETIEARASRLLSEHNIRLGLREGLIAAPTFRLLSSTEGGQNALDRGTVAIRHWAASEGVPSETTLAEAARHMLASVPENTSLAWALVVIPEEEENAAEFRNVHFLLSDGEQQSYTMRGFDLHTDVGYEQIAATALELIQRKAEQIEVSGL